MKEEKNTNIFRKDTKAEEEYNRQVRAKCLDVSDKMKTVFIVDVIALIAFVALRLLGARGYSYQTNVLSVPFILAGLVLLVCSVVICVFMNSLRKYDETFRKAGILLVVTNAFKIASAMNLFALPFKDVNNADPFDILFVVTWFSLLEVIITFVQARCYVFSLKDCVRGSEFSVRSKWEAFWKIYIIVNVIFVACLILSLIPLISNVLVFVAELCVIPMIALGIWRLILTWKTVTELPILAEHLN